MRIHSAKVVAGGFGIALLLLCSAGLSAYLSIRRLNEDRGLVTHTYDVLERLSRISGQVGFGEMERQSYLLTQAEPELQTYLQIFQVAAQGLTKVRSLTRDNPRQQQRLDQLEPLIVDRATLFTQLLANARNKSDDLAQINRLLDRSINDNQQIQAILRSMIAEEQNLLQQRLATTDRRVNQVEVIMSLGYGIGLVLLLSVYLLLKQQNRFIQVLGKSQVRLEQAASRSRLANLMEQMTDAFVALDAEGRYTYVNQKAGELLYRQPEELIGLKIWQEFPEAVERPIYQVYQQAVTQQKFAQLEEYYPPFDRWYENRIYPSQSEVLIFFQDITARKQAEAELRQARDLLEVRVAERTSELAEAKERLEQELAERQRTEATLHLLTEQLQRSNQELQQFAYIASHDLQEPLRAIAGYTQILEREYRENPPNPAVLQEAMQYILDGAARMRQLIQDLLLYSRVGAVTKELGAVDCQQVVQEVLLNLQVAIAETQAQILFDSLPMVYADRTQLVQLFQNLLGNAIKFHGELPPQIQIQATQQEQAWLFSVQDRGIGIKAQYRERIFEVFRRLHTRREFSGTGIGLAICRKIVEQYGGRIWVESTPTIGTTFYFTLPFSLHCMT